MDNYFVCKSIYKTNELESVHLCQFQMANGIRYRNHDSMHLIYTQIFLSHSANLSLDVCIRIVTWMESNICSLLNCIRKEITFDLFIMNRCKDLPCIFRMCVKSKRIKSMLKNPCSTLKRERKKVRPIDSKIHHRG